jgi:ribosomal protein S18 acetylase RimI-like enzyme
MTMRYFAYGSNLLQARLLERTPSARRIGRGKLSTFRLCWHKRGFRDGSGKCDAFETGNATDTVWGALFELADTERASLDAAEGLGRGYRDTQVPVETTRGVVTAFSYVATPDALDRTLAPFGWYRDLVVAGARESGLPDRYICTLAAARTVADPDHGRAQRHRRLLGGVANGLVEMENHRADRVWLRPATADDQHSIVDICKTSIATTYGVFMDRERMRPWVEGREVEEYVARMWPHMTVAAGDMQILGVVALDGHVIDLLWIRADVRGQGVGSLLMDRAESMLAADHDVAELECFAPNHASIAFYETRGYAAVRTYYEEASGVDKVVMTKRIRPVRASDGRD